MKSFLLNQFTSKWWSRSYPGSSWRCRQQFLEKKMICKVFSSISLLLSPSAPMETNLTPLLAMKSRALLTLAILWNLKSCRINISWIKLTLLNPHGDNLELLTSPHLASIWLRQGLAWDDLQQQHQLEAIPEVLLDVLNLGTSFS